MSEELQERTRQEAEGWRFYSLCGYTLFSCNYKARQATWVAGGQLAMYAGIIGGLLALGPNHLSVGLKCAIAIPAFVLIAIGFACSIYGGYCLPYSPPKRQETTLHSSL